ncbi:MAG: efflux RND transporter periplasmic adaptor subunit [Epsilonproteobacteria bacterium]|nr:efflux RND transporter periplasmic adaptor subunit [Campylobacterota bacterium]
MNKSILSTVGAALVVGIGIGYGVTLLQAPKVQKEASTKGVDTGKKVLFYRNAMNPSVTSPVPSKDSMGMDYIPVYADGAKSDEVAGTVKIDPTVVQNIGVRTAKVKVKALSKTIRAIGRVDFDEERMARLHPKTEGWIEKIFVDKTGETVKEDDILVSIYSPQLVSTEQEYLLALNSLKTLQKSPFRDVREGAEEMVKSTRERLVLLDVPEHQIKELEESRIIKKNLHIHTSVAGTVIKIGSRVGQYVTPKTELYMVVDLSKVWVYAEIYEYEIPWVKLGDTVEMTLASVPGRTFKGTLSYIYPYTEAKTRTTRVRIVFDNKELLLRPDMFAEIKINSDTQKAALVIPSEAVIRSWNNTQVFIVRGKGKYEPRKVKLGIESHGHVVVLAGLREGDEVVTSAQFLIDSESKLREATAKMLEVSQNPKKMDMNRSKSDTK